MTRFPLHVCLRLLSFVYFASLLVPLLAAAADRPNFFWISIENYSPTLGCYGDKYAA